MTVHEHPPGTPQPDAREAFLVDGCDRCAEYVRDLGLPFDSGRFRAFWAKMIDVEFDDRGGYGGQLDRELGRSLYNVALALQRAFGLDSAALRFPGAFQAGAVLLLPEESAESARIEQTIFPSIEEFHAARPERERSPEVDFGVDWWDEGTSHPKYRLSWIEATREIYAVCLATPDTHPLGGRVEILGVLGQQEVRNALEGWADLKYSELRWARERIGAA